MKNLIKIAMVACLVLSIAACRKNVQNDDMLADENLSAPTTVDVVVEETPVIIDVQNTEIALRQVNFALDKYNLSDAAKKVLADNAALIKTKTANAAFNIVVEGHCDERGTISYNIALGEKRANEVKNYYTRLGVPAKNIVTVSYGEEKPLCYDATENCYAKNRRAETVLTVK
ncbi:Outer membrane protein [Elusimicrobium minutum Pei191]|uniref:Peptidoglycan-associated lipoprotein n=1 Tax=Elusimicrobium minutum (strain Pei191) TaxID=445932 RepID=B2KE81_ELUMP|nr:OmpA family protein [Elusimicrobium minutum]ACC98827.1 Outer membrane protein [Elusimicrobium minutum Pei191]